ncbi:DapH/DapD/GlmU-related protein [Aeromicrobium sp. CF4.19]|uniref:DapH/DapD/GlmU-related protein n=1 Tax=Aeromicrobium sp. CF4.19 TaxID=3373082 RepID=UPI003EE6D222
MKRPVVTLVSGSFWPREGGAERQLRTVLSELAASSERVQVVTQALPGQPKRYVDPHLPLTVHRVGSSAALSKAPRLGQLTFVVAAFLQVLCSRPATVVSLQFGSATVAASMAANIIRARHVVRLTGGGSETFRSEPEARASSSRGRLLVQIGTWGRGKLLIAPARHLLNDFSEFFPSIAIETRLLPNGVDVDPPHAGTETSRLGVLWYARSGTPRDAPVLHEVAAHCPELSFTVIGAAVDSTLPNIQSAGWIEKPASLLTQVRCLLNTSPSEGSPNLALQAISSGCHVVGGQNAGLEELRGDFPTHVHTCDLADPTEVAQELLRCHLLELPGQGRVTTSTEASRMWREEMIGATSLNSKRTIPAPKPLIAWLAYALFVSHLPSWLRTGKRLRVLCARGFCASVDKTATINRKARLSWRVTIGPHGGVGERSILSGEVHIGPHVTMGPDCYFVTGDHPVPPDHGSFRDMRSVHRPIRVEEDAFIGGRVTVLPGVTIGRGAAVGAGSVVAKDVPPGATVVGNPAKIVKTRKV